MDFSNPDLKELACLIYETLKNSGINAVLVGGACVSIYSHNRYQSSDLDFATCKQLSPKGESFIVRYKRQYAGGLHRQLLHRQMGQASGYSDLHSSRCAGGYHS